MNKTISTSLLILLASISALTPFATDGYLSAIPVIAQDLNTDISLIAVTVSLYILGLAIGQLIGGPLSDKYGRKPIILAGLIIFSLTSFAIPYAHSLTALWLIRILQAIGGGIAVVGVPAIIRDNSSGKDSARLFSMIMLITMIAPSIAPSVGTLILKIANWQWIFTSLALLAIAVILAVLVIMPDLAKPQNEGLKDGYLKVFKERRALKYLIVQSFTFSVLMTFLTNAPFAYLEYYKIDETLFSALLVLNVIAVTMMNRVNSFLLNYYEPTRLLIYFLTLQLLGVVILITTATLFADALYLTVLGFVLSTSSMGGVIPNSSACFMNYFEKNAGTAAATLGASQYLIGAAVSALAALMTTDSLWPIILVMLAATLIAISAAVCQTKGQHYDGTNTLNIT